MKCVACGFESDVTGPVNNAYCFYCGSFRNQAAIAAMQGLLANPSVIGSNPNCGWGYVNCDANVVSDFALAHADALLAELARPKEKTDVNT